MENLSLEQQEATRGGFLNHDLNGNKVTALNSAVSVNVADVLGSGNRSGGVAVEQDAAAAAGNIVSF